MRTAKQYVSSRDLSTIINDELRKQDRPAYNLGSYFYSAVYGLSKSRATSLVKAERLLDTLDSMWRLSELEVFVGYALKVTPEQLEGIRNKYNFEHSNLIKWLAKEFGVAQSVVKEVIK